MITPHKISQTCSTVSSTRLSNVRSNPKIIKSSPPKYQYSHKFEHFKYAHTPYMRNSAMKKPFAAKSHIREASGFITTIGMLTIRKHLRLPQTLKLLEFASLGLVSKHQYHPQLMQFDVLNDPLWQANIKTKHGRFQPDRFYPFAFQHRNMV